MGIIAGVVVLTVRREGGREGGPHAQVLYAILVLEDQICVIIPSELSHKSSEKRLPNPRLGLEHLRRTPTRSGVVCEGPAVNRYSMVSILYVEHC